MLKYSRLKKEHLQLCYDPTSDTWMHASKNPYQAVEWKHLPKYAREAIPVLNIAGPGVWVYDMGETRVASNGIVHYSIIDPIQAWEMKIWQGIWHTRR